MNCWQMLDGWWLALLPHSKISRSICLFEWDSFLFLSFFFLVQWVLSQHWSVSSAVYKHWCVPLVKLERGWLEVQKTFQLKKFDKLVKHVHLLTFCLSSLRWWACSLFIVHKLWIFVIKPEMGIGHPPFSSCSTDTFSEVASLNALILPLFISDVLHVKNISVY